MAGARARASSSSSSSYYYYCQFRFLFMAAMFLCAHLPPLRMGMAMAMVAPAQAQAAQDVQINPTITGDYNTATQPKHEQHKHMRSIRPTLAAGILFVVLFAAVCAALFCYVYSARSKMQQLTQQQQQQLACKTYAVHVAVARKDDSGSNHLDLC